MDAETSSMSWKQRGMIFRTDGRQSWSRTHTQLPSAIAMNDVIRVYYGTRDDNNRSRIGFVELDPANPSHVVRVHGAPVLDLGESGAHDEDGVIPSHVIPVGDELFMYYGGVSRGGSVPYRMSIGLARSRDGGLTFQRMFRGPVVDRTPEEPFMTMAPHVYRDGSQWTMWYGSGTGWVDVNGKSEPTYVIKLAASGDGIRWERSNHTCIKPLHPHEANTRPAVLRTGDGYNMWFCHRDSRDYRDGAGAYRIGHAWSKNGKDWKRASDPAGLAPKGAGWNSVAMAYPCVIVLNGTAVMFHNGDGFGRAGFGYAVLSESA